MSKNKRYIIDQNDNWQFNCKSEWLIYEWLVLVTSLVSFHHVYQLVDKWFKRHRVVVLQPGLEVQSSRLPVRHSSLTLIILNADSETLFLESFLGPTVLLPYSVVVWCFSTVWRLVMCDVVLCDVVLCDVVLCDVVLCVTLCCVTINKCAAVSLCQAYSFNKSWQLTS